MYVWMCVYMYVREPHPHTFLLCEVSHAVMMMMCLNTIPSPMTTSNVRAPSCKVCSAVCKLSIRMILQVLYKDTNKMKFNFAP